MSMDKYQLLIAAVSALAVTVGVLWKLHLNQVREQKQRLETHTQDQKDKIEKQDEIISTMNEKQIEQAESIGELRGRMDGIEELSDQVLKTVHKAIVERDSGEIK